jgi:hypothetical protein
LHSIIGASVLARSSATMLAVIAGISFSVLVADRAGQAPGSRLRSIEKKGLKQPRVTCAGERRRGVKPLR